MMFLDCPAWLDQQGAARCGLPAEVSCRFTMRSTDGPVEGAMIRCPAGHYFCAAIESLIWDGNDKHGPAPAGLGSRAGRASLRHGHDGPLADGEPAPQGVPAEPQRIDRRPNTAPAHYLGHPACLWITVMRPRRRHTTSPLPMQTMTGDGKQSPSRRGGPLAGVRAETVSVTPAATPWSVTRVQ